MICYYYHHLTGAILHEHYISLADHTCVVLFMNTGHLGVTEYCVTGTRLLPPPLLTLSRVISSLTDDPAD